VQGQKYYDEGTNLDIALEPSVVAFRLRVKVPDRPFKIDEIV
jgi:hypothetical protein